MTELQFVACTPGPYVPMRRAFSDLTTQIPESTPFLPYTALPVTALRKMNF